MIYIIFPLRMKHTWKNLDISLSTTNMNPPVTGALSNKVKLKWKKRRRVFWLDVWAKVTSSSRRLRSVQDANQWLTTGVSKTWKMPWPALLCRLPSATSDFGSAMTSNYVMTRKVPQTDSTDTHTKFFRTGATCTLGERSTRHRASMRPLASQALLLCLLSKSENAISALTDPRM